MKYNKYTALTLLLLFYLPRLSESETISLENKKTSDLSFNYKTTLMVRQENWNWFGNQNDAYDFRLSRLRFDARIAYKQFEIFAQPQYVIMQDVPDQAGLPSPQGPSGMGALYYAHNEESNFSSIGFHQFYLKASDLFSVGTELKLGRFTYASGLEYQNPQDGQKFNTLKTMRLADRMISSFEWSAFARSFDGAQWKQQLPQNYHLTASILYPTQGGWEKDFNESMEDVRIATTTLTAPKGKLLEHTEMQVFAYNYSDERNCTQRIDNSGQSCSNEADINISMTGAHIQSIYPFESIDIDFLAWGGYQWGDWYELKHEAYAFTLETGIQFKQVWLKPWIRTGYYYGSGDSDSSDGSHGTFFQMAPGTRKYQLFPYYDLQNIEYAFLQLFLFPTKDLTLRIDYTQSALAESEDLWYMGTGPTQNDGDIFGYLARPSQGQKDLSQEISLMANYKFNEHLSLSLFYAHVFGDDVIKANYTENSDADYASAEITFTF
jgi:hypothetical protein